MDFIESVTKLFFLSNIALNSLSFLVCYSFLYILCSCYLPPLMFVIHLIGHFFHVVFAVLSFLAVYVLLSPYFILNIVYCCPRILRQAPGGGGAREPNWRLCGYWTPSTIRLRSSFFFQAVRLLTTPPQFVFNNNNNNEPQVTTEKLSQY